MSRRPILARFLIAAFAGGYVLALAGNAAARNDLDLREIFRPPAPPAASSAPAEPPAVARVPRTTARPLVISLSPERGRHSRVAARPHPAKRLEARRAPPRRPVLATLPPERSTLFAPLPTRPAIVSIYADSTLRQGDAVMMADGIRVFSGQPGSVHRPADFVRLTRITGLSWQFRKTLTELDDNPPDRWS